MRDYYESEIRLLTEFAQEFSEAYPEQAGMLNLNEVKDRDPYVERLLEGMAFLTAQVRQQIDDDIPEISETLLNQVKPDLLFPFPSATIIQFQPRLGHLQQRKILAKGKVLLSESVGEEKTVCKFTTTSEVEILPLNISDVSLTNNTLDGSNLVISIAAEKGINIATLGMKYLKIYIHDDPSISLWLMQQICSELKSITLSGVNNNSPFSFTSERQESIFPNHLDDGDILIQSNASDFSGFNILMEYFCFREKYLFFTINLNEIVSAIPDCNAFKITIHLNSNIPNDHNIDKETFKLYCTPAVNVYNSMSEPILITHKKTSYAVHANINQKLSESVYSVTSVQGVDYDSGGRREYTPMGDFKHRESNSNYYHIHRSRHKSVSTNTHIHISSDSKFENEILSCHIKATNGSYPRRFLNVGSINIPPSDSPSYVSFTNITRPTNSLHAPERKYFQWDLISNLSLNIRSFSELNNFLNLLKLYDWSDDKQNAQRIEGVKNIKIETVERISKGALIRGLVINLTLQENKYRSDSDIWLFGLILHNVLSMYTSINCFIETKVTTFPSNREFSWKPIIGKNIPI